MEYELKSTSASGARREAARRWPKNDVSITGYAGDEVVYISLVRNVTKGNVATATKGIAATRFIARVVGIEVVGTYVADTDLVMERLLTIGTHELIGKLDIWVRENLPENDLLNVVIARLESQAERIEELEEAATDLLSGRIQMP